MKKSNLYLLITLIIISLSVAYSAFNSELLIEDIIAEVRIKSDIRITAFEYSSSTNEALSIYNNYNVKSISPTISLPNEQSTITYKINITNIGNEEMGIYEITGLPENLTYELSEYTLKNKICDTSNNCSLGITKEFYITIKYLTYDSTNITYDLNLSFDFQPFHTITYENIESDSYPTEIINNDTLIINFKDNAPSQLSISIAGEIITDYTYNSGILKIKNITGDVIIKKSRELVCYLAEDQDDNNSIDVGDIITCGANNPQKFYVIPDHQNSSENTISLLAETNITIEDNPTQSINTSTISFASSQYWSDYDKDQSTKYSNIYYAYDSNSLLYTYLENYKNALTTDGVEGVAAELIYYNQMLDLGCEVEDSRKGTKFYTQLICTSAPSWLYSTNYWTGFPFDNMVTYGENIVEMKTTGLSETNGTLYTEQSGIRPVIIIPISEVKIS